MKKVINMKINHLISGILIATVMLVCGSAFAGTYKYDGILAAAPTDTVMTYTVEPPLVSAVKPNSNGFALVMTGEDYGDNKETTCMACNIPSKQNLAAASFYRLKVADNAIPRTVLACGYESKLIPIPTKIPIAV